MNTLQDTWKPANLDNKTVKMTTTLIHENMLNTVRVIATACASCFKDSTGSVNARKDHAWALPG